jgi:multiple RNA-binding domain-containing protein 1
MLNQTDAVVSSVSNRFGLSKSEILDPTSSDAAVKQAHAETLIIAETRAYFKQHGVDLEAFKNRERGDTAILVKNFPYETPEDTLKQMFEDFGSIRRLLIPPAGTIAIIEFSRAVDAQAAYRSLAYKKLGNSVLYLEKAPKDIFKNAPEVSDIQIDVSGLQRGKEAKLSVSDLLQSSDDTMENLETATLYVRNLNFDTTTEGLIKTFKPLEGFLSAVVRTKTNPKDESKPLSMGYGFVEFRTKAQAQAALSAMNGHDVDGYNILIKASHKGFDAAEKQRREDRAKKQVMKRTKIIIKNLPFEATKKDVRALFGTYGQLRTVRVPKKVGGESRGFAFAEFSSVRDAENAIEKLRNTHLLGRKLVLDFAEEEPEDAEEELAKMQQKVGSQLNKVALRKLTATGRKKFNVAGDDEE